MKSPDGLTAVHRTIIALLRHNSTADANPLALTVHGLSDDEFARWLFRNYRGVGVRKGLRLSDLGLQLMKCYFRPYETPTPEGYKISPAHVLFFDKKTTLPYHLSSQGVVLFELKLGIELKLAEGDIQTLVDMDDAANPPR